MKFLVFLCLVLFAGRHVVLSQQLHLPAFQPPAFEIPNPSDANVFKVQDQAQPNLNIRTFDQFFNPSPAVFPANPISNLIQQIPHIFNVSSLHNLFSPPGFRQLNTDVDYTSIPLMFQKSVRDAVENFNKALNASITRSLERLENTVKRLNETALSIITTNQNAVTTNIDNLRNKIETYNETVQNCVAQNATPYQEIIETALDEAIECVHEKRNEGFAIIDEGRQSIINATYGAQNFTTAIQECSSPDVYNKFPFGLIGCYTSALTNIRRETIMLPITLAKVGGKIDRAVVTVQSDAVQCAANVAESIETETLDVTRTIANCLLTD